jgi:TIR domain
MPSGESLIPSPKIFASYAWSDERSTMVREVCERLMADGVNVLLDQWHLKEGDDVYNFMEQCVNDPTVTAVLLFCDKLYAQKANDRTGGAGAESQMISPEIYKNLSNSKFIPLICERDEAGKECRPHFVKSRFYIDFSSDELLNANWEQLIRRINGKPQFKEPPLGLVPSYILEPERQPRQSAGKFLYWKQTAAKNGPLLSIAERDYLAALIEDLKNLYLSPTQIEEAHEQLLEKFNSAKMLRDELLDLFAVNAAQTSGRPGSGRIGPILDRLLDLRSFDYNIGGISAVRNDALDLFLFIRTFSLHDCPTYRFGGIPGSRKSSR